MTSSLMIFATMKNGLVNKTPCVVSFFEDDILLTSIGPETKKRLVEDRKQAAREAGENRLKASLAGFSALSDYADSVRAMDYGAILKEDTRTVPRDSIKKMKFSAASERRSMDNASSATDDGKLTIKLSNERMTLAHREEDPSGNIAAFVKKYIR